MPCQRIEYQEVDDCEQRAGQREQPQPVGDFRVLDRRRPGSAPGAAAQRCRQQQGRRIPPTRVTARSRAWCVVARARSGNSTTLTNCGKNSAAFARISPEAYSPLSWTSNRLRAISESRLLSTKYASSACVDSMASRRSGRRLIRVPAVGVPEQQSGAGHDGEPGSDGDADHGRRRGGGDDQRERAAAQPPDSVAQVDRGERAPSGRALGNTGGGAHDRQRHEGRSAQDDGPVAVELQRWRQHDGGCRDDGADENCHHDRDAQRSR